ncbi:hypothetical protein TG4357_02781 [Thalassovita gelatinovora]|uniref:Uncharacterized protein n=1 Tax=Thalassovita gelatinovora TaxID=53501 RepID=A0A0P1G2C7_THAGE|nr:hypothetical protein [Thalassovita gelatinovora]QIZ79897.1 hypothetical protein HFZ77_05070 [Thalassovita gelatinovora]CUH67016.1 hypothetical protein TG4357_02781 [Thalassovita gelatinovora]SEQ47059.1 hypothetical protein SAMN04488043_105319 [Thalassovita gelatinovora]
MSREQSPLFLERRSYRVHRAMDAAKLMPFLGAVLWAVPVLWSGSGENQVPTSRAILYIFLIWAALAAVTLFLTFWLDENVDSDRKEGP